MHDPSLSADERASITSLARKIVDRTAPTSSGGASERDVAGSDAQLAERLAALESRIEVASRTWSANLKAVLVAVERLETRSAKLDGEVAAHREIIATLEMAADERRESLTSGARQFAETAAAQLGAVLDRMDKLVAETSRARKAEFAPSADLAGNDRLIETHPVGSRPVA